MTPRHIARAAQRHLTDLYRDHRTLPMFFLVPLMLTLLIGWVLRTSERDATIAIVAEEHNWAVRDIASYMEESFEQDGVEAQVTDDRAGAQRAVESGEIDALIAVDRELVAAVLRGEDHQIEVAIRGDDLGASTKIRESAERALVIAPLQALRKATDRPAASPGSPVDVATSYVYTDDAYELFDHLAPSLFAFAVFLAVFSSGLVAMSGERALHTVERLLASPLRRWEILSGRVIGYFSISLAQAAIIALAAIWVLDIRHTGTVIEAVAICGVISLAASTMGLWLSGFARSEPEAMQLLPMILVPQSLLCGVIFPVSALPEALQWVSRALPLTYGIEALRELMLRGHHAYEGAVLGNLAILLGFAAVFLLLGVRELKPLSE